MTPAELAEIEERLNKATRGPWIVEELDGYITGHITSAAHSYSGNLASRRDSITDPNSMTAADAQFIAHAPTSISTLIKAVRELEKELADAKQAYLNMRQFATDNGLNTSTANKYENPEA